MRRRATDGEIARMRGVLSYQFNEAVALALIPEGSEVEVEVSSKGKIRYVFVDHTRLLTLRPTDGLFSLSLDAARRIVKAVDPPRFRVIVRGETELMGSVLIPEVIDIDPLLRPGDEVVVVDRRDNVLGVGRLRIPRALLAGLVRGEVVRIRKRVKQ